MLDLGSYKTKQYQFKDGDNIYTCKTLTQELWMKLNSAKASPTIEVIDDILLYILPEELGKDYVSALPLEAKIALFKDYFAFIRDSLTNVFPSANNTQ